MSTNAPARTVEYDETGRPFIRDREVIARAVAAQDRLMATVDAMRADYRPAAEVAAERDAYLDRLDATEPF